ncbi:branched-chain amino acid ABC transporter permease [Candidatus Pacearchaeota archaeon]|nr:branched-chain amino acid ABC transporter permease [Candidatus Pacearchaeota archaeon]
MSLLTQLTVNGLIAGSIYALVASGFSLIYGTNRFMHFAHGISVVIAGYILYSLFTVWKIPIVLSIFITLVLSGIFGLGIYRLIYLPLQNKKASNVILLMASIAILILFQNLIQAFYGADIKTIGYIKVGKGLSFIGAVITKLQIAIIIVSLLLLISLYFFMKKTKLGRDMRAVSDNKELASIVGINQRRVSDYSFILGSALAGVAGVLIALEQNLEPAMGTTLIIKGFTGAVIGGISYVPASVLGSYILGVAENYGIWFLPSGYKDAIAFVLLFIFLLFRPSGLFGLKRRAA